MSNKKRKKQGHRAEMRRLKRLKKQTSKSKKPETIKPIEKGEVKPFKNIDEYPMAEVKGSNVDGWSPVVLEKQRKFEEEKKQETASTKVAEPIIKTKLMEEKTKKLLLFLPANNKWARIIRRGIIIFVLAGFSGVGIEIAQNSGNYIPEVWMPIATAILAMIDKSLREFATKEKEA